LICWREKGLLPADWRKRLPHDSAPYTSTTIFLVRKGNPKNIRDWDDLAKPGIAVIVPNPKTSGNGRYTYLAAWGYAVKKGGDEAAARDFVARLFRNVPVLDGGGRGATTTFTQRGIGDVLATFENESFLIQRELGGEKFEVVYPSISIEAEAPVAMVDKVVERKGSRKQAQGYVEFLYSPGGPGHYRPTFFPAPAGCGVSKIRRAVQVDSPVHRRRGVWQPGAGATDSLQRGWRV
jgi:sulfate transport system substrate-binding protein